MQFQGGSRIGAEVPDQLASLRCDEVVRRPVARVSEDDDVFDAMEVMIAERVRRLPVVDERGELVGIFSLDDALALLSRTLVRLTALPEAQRDEERELRP